MSYAIGNVIYGTEVRYKAFSTLEHILFEEPPEELKDHEYESCGDYLETLGFELEYTQADYPVAWIGEQLHEIDECDTVKVSELTALQAQITPLKHREIAEKVAALPTWLQELLIPIDLYIIWSSS